MEPQKTLKLIKSAVSFKLIVTEFLEKKIRLACSKIWDVEWSGILFYRVEGTMENNDLVIKGVDFFPMDIGTSTYTEFQNSPEAVAYMAEADLLDCQVGLIH
jgi:hypothetical protein